MLPRPRLVVLGLDGLPLSLARRLAPDLPNLGRLVPEAREIAAELPELSPVNWTSLATGAGPGEHGVYGFVRLAPRTYAVSLTDSSCVACPTVFERLGEHGLVSRVVNLPNTYPARPLRGMLVAGFVAERLDRAVYPPFLAGALSRVHYRLEADTSRGASDPAYLLAELSATLDSRLAALDLLWPDLAWDLFVFVLTETDRLFHFLFPVLEDETHPWHGPCREFLRKWDQAIGRILEHYDDLPGPKRLLVLADHGFATLKIEVDLNRWLCEAGLLKLLPAQARGAEAELEAGRIAPGSAALALDPGRVYLHTKRRFSRGQMDDAAAERLLPELRQALSDLTFQGERVMEKVLYGRELYAGACAPAAPDLVCVPRPGFDLKAKFNRDAVFGLYGRSGTHTAGDVFFYDSAGSQPTRVRDAGQEILRHFGPACPSISNAT